MAVFPAQRPVKHNPFDKLSLFDAAKMLDVKVEVIRTAIFKGQLRAVRVSKTRRMVRRDQLMAFKAKLEVAALEAQESN